MLVVFSEVYTVWVHINNLFFHLCNFHCDSVLLLSLITKDIINPFFNEKTI